MPKAIRLLLLIITTVALASCDKPTDTNRIVPKITTSIEGNLHIENYNFAGITIEIGDQQTTLSSSGYFYFENVTVDEELANITISGYGNYPKMVVKTFVPQKTLNYLNIELPENFLVANRYIFNTTSAIDYTSGVSVKLDANSYVHRGTTTNYSGSAYYQFDLTDPAYEIQPFGIPYALPLQGTYGEDASGNLFGVKMLSYIFYLHFATQNDQLLSLAAGKKVTIQTGQWEPGAVMTGTPPYFLYRYNTTTGRWIKMSEATQTTTPSKFTAQSDSLTGFFVFATPYDIVKFKARLVAPDGLPISTMVQFNKTGERNKNFTGNTNRFGEITGYLPKGDNIELNVIQTVGTSDYIYVLRDLIFKKSLGVINSETDFGDITCTNIGDTVNRAIINLKGKVVDCNGNPVANAKLNDSYTSHFQPNVYTDQNGNFNYYFTRGSASGPFFVTLRAWSPAGEVTGQMFPLNNTKKPEVTVQNLGTIKICNTNTDEYVKFIIDGVATEYRRPTNNIGYNTGPVSISDTFIRHEMVTINNNTVITYQGNSFPGSRPLFGPLVPGVTISQYLNNPRINISENRNSGSFYTRGVFEGYLVKYTDGSTHTISADFRLKN
jgi:hypothetical protein